MTFQALQDELVKNNQEITERMKSLKFLEENGFTSLVDVADKIESEGERLLKEVALMIQQSLDEKPKNMDEKEKQVWFAILISRLTRIHEMVEILATEVESLRKE